MSWVRGSWRYLSLALFWMGWSAVADPVRLGTYNVENYLLAPIGTRAAKSEASKEKVADSIQAMEADVVGLVELGGVAALDDLRARVARRGVEYRHAALVTGFDTNIQVGLISRFPLRTVRGHTNDSFLLAGRRLRTSRGFLEADVEVPGGRVLTVFVAHLKSRRTSAEANEADWRREEARILREKVDARLASDPGALIAVLGDLNDVKNSETIRVLLGKGRDRLVDTRPSESNGDTGFTPNPRWEPRTVTWTHYYGLEDSYSRVDYLLLHPKLEGMWDRSRSRIVVVPDWGQASDHRPLVVTLKFP